MPFERRRITHAFHLVVWALALVAGCGDPTEPVQPLYVAISGPDSIDFDSFGVSPYVVHACRFFITAKATGGARDERVHLATPLARVELASGAPGDGGMLYGWEEQHIASGQEVRGEFYLSAYEPFQVELVSAWIMRLDSAEATYGNTIEFNCP